MYGVSGPFWYGAGATFQIFMFALAGECFLHQKKKKEGNGVYAESVPEVLQRIMQMTMQRPCIDPQVEVINFPGYIQRIASIHYTHTCLCRSNTSVTDLVQHFSFNSSFTLTVVRHTAHTFLTTIQPSNSNAKHPAPTLSSKSSRSATAPPATSRSCATA